MAEEIEIEVKEYQPPFRSYFLIFLFLFNIWPLGLAIAWLGIPGLSTIINLLFFLPTLFWINIPGIPLALLGIPGFGMGEFGAMPKGFLAYALLVLCWTLLAFLAARIITSVKHKINSPAGK